MNHKVQIVFTSVAAMLIGIGVGSIISENKELNNLNAAIELYKCKTYTISLLEDEQDLLNAAIAVVGKEQTNIIVETADKYKKNRK